VLLVELLAQILEEAVAVVLNLVEQAVLAAPA
jgi:hypothetical protein